VGDVTPHTPAILRFCLRLDGQCAGPGPEFPVSRRRDAVSGGLGVTLYLRTASDNSVLGLTAAQLRDELSVYSKAQVEQPASPTGVRTLSRSPLVESQRNRLALILPE
jgi:hypothetical protein